MADGLSARDLLAADRVAELAVDDIGREADVILSFGGDGTMLNTAHIVADRSKPILGINIGRLGFLADIEVEQVRAAITAIEAGRYRIEERMAMEVDISSNGMKRSEWAINEVVVPPVPR